MIQFNLVPDVKQHYLKVRRSKRMVILGALAVSGVAIFILIFLFLAVSIFQQKHLNDLTKDINADSNKLQSMPDLSKILTVQNQISSLSTLHGQKPVTSRLFGYLTQIVPNKVSISRLDINFAQHSMEIEGDADSLTTINQFVDTLKFTTFKANSTSQDSPAFSHVVLENFGIDTNASYKVGLNFDPGIFASADSPTLTVPNIITTRANLEAPKPLFQPSPNPPTNSSNTSTKP